MRAAPRVGAPLHHHPGINLQRPSQDVEIQKLFKVGQKDTLFDFLLVLFSHNHPIEKYATVRFLITSPGIRVENTKYI